MFVPASNTKIVVSAVAAALFAARLHRADQRLWQRARRERRRSRATSCSTAAATRPSASAATPSTPPPPAPATPNPMQKLRELAAQLARAGITSVSGDVVGDGSWFEPTLVHPAWENYDLNWWYAAPVSGLGFNDNSIDIKYSTSDSVGPAGDADLHARLRRRHAREPAPAPCRAGRTRPSTSSAPPGRSPSGPRATSRPGAASRAPSTSPCPIPTSSPRGRSAPPSRRRASPSSAPRAPPPTPWRTRSCAAARRSPRSPAARSRTGSSRSSTPARTGTPR